MRAVIVAGWRRVRPGREESAAQLVVDVTNYWTEHAGQGRCSEPKWRWRGHGAGHWFVEGPAEELLLLSATPEAALLAEEAPFSLDDYEEHLYATGSRPWRRSMETLLRDGDLI